MVVVFDDERNEDGEDVATDTELRKFMMDGCGL